VVIASCHIYLAHGEDVVDLLNSPTGTDLYEFLRTNGGTRAKQEVLLFWILHPNASFSKLAVLSAMECSRIDVERALTDMVHDKLVDTHCHNGLATYSLTSNEDIRRMMALFGTLDWSQRRIIFDNNRLVHSACNLTSGKEAV
jgi:hypothetical protein